MIYDLFYVSLQSVDFIRWNKFKERFPTAQKLENIKSFEQLKSFAFTNMFWVVWDDLEIASDFDFSHKANKWDNMYIHVFRNGEFYDGVCLFPKNISISKREFDNRYFINKKEIPIDASWPLNKYDNKQEYDIVFISYTEPNADKNFERLIEKCPNSKRVHGVKGIHQAHIQAAKLSSTEMLWIVDGDAEILPNFNFNYRVARYNKNVPHVWRSRNPINDLEYGYGGVKLFPKDVTLNMDLNTSDMTTSLADRIVVIDEVSNITAFNTDPFNAWKSAFRECCKLASRIIKGQIDKDTEGRLEHWCSDYGQDRLYGVYAIKGARAGRKYGIDNKNNKDNLILINDFEWLKNKFLEELNLNK